VVLSLSPVAFAGATFTEAGASILGGLSVDARSGSFADIDNDGDVDLLIQGATAAKKLLRNNIIGTGAATFTDISSMLHFATNGPTWSACWADVDSDGDVDVFIGSSNSHPDVGDFLRNDGGLGFTDASVATNLDDPGFHQNVAWADIDSDGDLDLILAMEGPTEEHEIYLQGPGMVFTPVGAAAGFQQPVGVKAYGMAIGDTDGDGDLDVYISTCRADNNIRNNFYENRLAQTGVLSFVDIADTNGTQFTRNSYGAEFQDMDDDGDLDLVMVGADGEATKIFRNNGGNQFTDVDTITGNPLLSDTAGDLNGGKAVDYDNDGDLDLFFHDHRPLHGHDKARKLYRNDGNWVFTDVTVAEGLHTTNVGGYDSAWADFDLDGDMDLFFPTEAGVPERFFRSNASTNGHHWLHVSPRAPAPNTRAIGAQLYATIHIGTPQQRTLRREANTNAGTFNQSDVPVHFGLGTATQVDKLRIVWPGGTEQHFCNVAGDVHRMLIAAVPGDFDGDGARTGADIAALTSCLGGPSFAPAHVDAYCADACLSAFDFDGDDDVDLADAAEAQRVWAAP
jgi:hypothetical protein